MMAKTTRSIDSAIIINNDESPTIIWVIGLIIDDGFKCALIWDVWSYKNFS